MSGSVETPTLPPIRTGRWLADWPARRWLVALTAAILITLITAIPTALIATPWFDREIPVTWWSWPVLITSSTLAGLVTATYVRRPGEPAEEPAQRPGGWLPTLGALGSWFAVGCPVCNKLVLLALGYSGALQFFAPLQGYLALASIALLGWALVTRVRRERACPTARPH